MITNQLYSLREERFGAFIIFYNKKDLKVKAYYLVKNKVKYVYRYYYNPFSLIVKQEKWKGNHRLTSVIYRYHSNKRIKEKQFYIGKKLRSLTRYTNDGEIIERKEYPEKLNVKEKKKTPFEPKKELDNSKLKRQQEKKELSDEK